MMSDAIRKGTLIEKIKDFDDLEEAISDESFEFCSSDGDNFEPGSPMFQEALDFNTKI